MDLVVQRDVAPEGLPDVGDLDVSGALRRVQDDPVRRDPVALLQTVGVALDDVHGIEIEAVPALPADEVADALPVQSEHVQQVRVASAAGAQRSQVACRPVRLRVDECPVCHFFFTPCCVLFCRMGFSEDSHNLPYRLLVYNLFRGPWIPGSSPSEQPRVPQAPVDSRQARHRDGVPREPVQVGVREAEAPDRAEGVVGEALEAEAFERRELR